MCIQINKEKLVNVLKVGLALLFVIVLNACIDNKLESNVVEPQGVYNLKGNHFSYTLDLEPGGKFSFHALGIFSVYSSGDWHRDADSITLNSDAQFQANVIVDVFEATTNRSDSIYLIIADEFGYRGNADPYPYIIEWDESGEAIGKEYPNSQGVITLDSLPPNGLFTLYEYEHQYDYQIKNTNNNYFEIRIRPVRSGTVYFEDEALIFRDDTLDWGGDLYKRKSIP